MQEEEKEMNMSIGAQKQIRALLEMAQDLLDEQGESIAAARVNGVFDAMDRDLAATRRDRGQKRDNRPVIVPVARSGLRSCA